MVKKITLVKGRERDLLLQIVLKGKFLISLVKFPIFWEN